MSFHHPSIWWLLGLLVVPLLWWRWVARRRQAAVAFSSTDALVAVGRHLGRARRWIVPVLRTAAFVLLFICLARPQLADEQTRIFTEGVAIELIVDRSGSMRAMDFQIEGRPANRLQAVKQVVREFVSGGSILPGRPDDLIGLIAFARFADSLCPLTLDQDHLINAVDQTQFVTEREEDGTAIGDALALGVERLQSLGQRSDLQANAIKSKVIILLTDGESNVGDIDPLTAARMAATYGIKVYTIGAGTDNATAPVPVQDPFGNTFYRNVPVSIDEDTLREIAKITGGEYFRATDTGSLEQIYARIDELERTDIEQRRYTQYTELAVEPGRVGGVALPPLLAIVLSLLAFEIFLGFTRFRTLP